MKYFLEDREHDNKYDIKVFVLGGNNRVTIFRKLLLQFKNSKNEKFLKINFFIQICKTILALFCDIRYDKNKLEKNSDLNYNTP